jgi:hypothetical protein
MIAREMAPLADRPDHYLRPPLVDEERIALAAIARMPTVNELLARHHVGEKITPEDCAHALLALGVQHQGRGRDTAPVSVEFIRLFAGQILGPERVLTLEQRLAEIEDYYSKHPKARSALQLAIHFAQPEVRGWSVRNLRRWFREWLRNKVGHSD